MAGLTAPILIVLDDSGCKGRILLMNKRSIPLDLSGEPRFILDCIPDDAGIKKRLWKAVSERKPFRNFKYVIDGSEYRQKWFDFRRIQLERLVTDYLNSLDIDALAE